MNNNVSFKSLVKNYQVQNVSCQGSVRSIDLHALDSKNKIYFITGCVKKDFFTALLMYYER